VRSSVPYVRSIAIISSAKKAKAVKCESIVGLGLLAKESKAKERKKEV
jgi:hypothetical protein